ncbi:MAG: hypothetical protein FJX65_16280 [Alphaproteobacteria bacterium]|nr:hypothetical protein [Alphaproteobacteria bacterium]
MTKSEMTAAEIEATLTRAGLDVPADERREIEQGVALLGPLLARLRRPRPPGEMFLSVFAPKVPGRD